MSAVSDTNGVNGPPASNGDTSGKAGDPAFDVAIVGGGIVGIILALGLLKRGIKIKIYEQARSFREIGAGVAFTATAQRCMHLLDPRILEAMKRVANQSKNDYNHYVDGYSHESTDPHDTFEKLLFHTPVADMGFWGCLRAHFLEELVKILPDGVVEFRKRLETYVDKDGGVKVLMQFTDGTTGEADAVIGCDGIKSRVRQILLGEDNPASYPNYTHKVAFRAIVPMGAAVAALSQDKAHNQCMHMGPGAHVLTSPLARSTLLNIVAFVTDPGEWVHDGDKLTAPATKTEVIEAFAEWSPAIQAVMRLLPDQLDKWAMFDMYDHPAPSYAKGRVCLAGDAAHSSTPHHGAGAGFGIEDALALGTILEEATSTLEKGAASKAVALSTAFQAYSAVRYERTQWLVQSSREIGDIYEWAGPETGRDADKCKAEVERRTRKIWDFDVNGMVSEAREEYGRRLNV